MTKVAVIGGGAWGTVFSQICADAGSSVCLLTRDPKVAKAINQTRRNPRSVPDLELPSGIEATTDPARALAGAFLVAVALKSQQARAVLGELVQLLEPGASVVSLMKGIEQGTTSRMSQVLAEVTGFDPSRVMVISGPNLAMELALRQPGATVVACPDEAAARAAATAFATPYLRPYTNPDVVGVEICGTVKNVVALAVGAAQGLGYGMNTSATLMTRGLAEMTRLGLALGADLETFAGMAGFADLAATCLSPKSRNHSVGLRLGEGMSVPEALAATAGTAEAIESAPAIAALAKSVGVEMPITAGLVAVVRGEVDVVTMGRELLARPFRSEGSRYEAWPDDAFSRPD
ncbi:MAG: NAD(P)-dependent glycerol-3-phosphate dehydrogenase [Micrococcales bacterium]|nr:NAD(P)-dependent glycerol-3-phosphate dehydrogenase [Micrococcales bacterium]